MKKDDLYEKVEGHIGCHKGQAPSRSNLGHIGNPSTFLKDGPLQCSFDLGLTHCVDLGKKACDAAPGCWGFAVWNMLTLTGIQIYNSSASNAGICDGRYGLEKNSGWETYKKNSGMHNIQNRQS